MIVSIMTAVKQVIGQPLIAVISQNQMKFADVCLESAQRLITKRILFLISLNLASPPL